MILLQSCSVGKWVLLFKLSKMVDVLMSTYAATQQWHYFFTKHKTTMRFLYSRLFYQPKTSLVALLTDDKNTLHSN